MDGMKALKSVLNIQKEYKWKEMLLAVLAFPIMCVVSEAACAGRRGCGGGGGEGSSRQAAGSGGGSSSSSDGPLSWYSKRDFSPNLVLTFPGTPHSRALPNGLPLPTGSDIGLLSTPIRVSGFRTTKNYSRKIAREQRGALLSLQVAQVLNCLARKSSALLWVPSGQVPASH